MGDNIHLGDRDGVRTPMQWWLDRNVALSRGDFATLYVPLILDPCTDIKRLMLKRNFGIPLPCFTR